MKNKKKELFASVFTTVLLFSMLLLAFGVSEGLDLASKNPNDTLSESTREHRDKDEMTANFVEQLKSGKLISVSNRTVDYHQYKSVKMRVEKQDLKLLVDEVIDLRNNKNNTHLSYTLIQKNVKNEGDGTVRTRYLLVLHDKILDDAQRNSEKNKDLLELVKARKNLTEVNVVDQFDITRHVNQYYN